MLSLGTVLAVHFPTASALDDYRVEDHADGQGPRLAYWNEAKLGPQPAAAQIATWAAEPLPEAELPRDPLAEIDAIKAGLIEKGVVVKEDIEAAAK